MSRARDLFGLRPDAELTGWIEITSATGLRGWYHQSEDGIRFHGAEISAERARSLILIPPVGFNPAAHSLVIVNPSPRSAEVKLLLMTKSGAPGGEVLLEVPPHGRIRAAPATVLPAIRENPGAYLRIETSVEVAATIAGVAGQSARGRTPGLIPVAQGGAVLQIVNAGADSRTLLIKARDATGQLLTGTENPREVLLPAGGLLRLEPAAGWIEIASLDPAEEVHLAGLVSYVPGESTIAATVQRLPAADRDLVSAALEVPIEIGDNNLLTEQHVALFNRDSQSTNVQVTVYGSSGNALATAVRRLDGGTGEIRSLQELFPALPAGPFEGSIETSVGSDDRPQTFQITAVKAEDRALPFAFALDNSFSQQVIAKDGYRSLSTFQEVNAALTQSKFGFEYQGPRPCVVGQTKLHVWSEWRMLKRQDISGTILRRDKMILQNGNELERVEWTPSRYFALFLLDLSDPLTPGSTFRGDFYVKLNSCGTFKFYINFWGILSVPPTYFINGLDTTILLWDMSGSLGASEPAAFIKLKNNRPGTHEDCGA